MEDEARNGGDSPLPGVDDDEVPDSPLPGAFPARSGDSGDAAMQPGGLAAEDDCAVREGEGEGPEAVEDSQAPSAALPSADVPALGKRREEAAESGLEAIQKRSRLGDALPRLPAYECLVLTAADGTKICAPRKIAAPKVGCRPRDARTPSAACSDLYLSCPYSVLGSACGRLRSRSGETNDC